MLVSSGLLNTSGEPFGATAIYLGPWMNGMRSIPAPMWPSVAFNRSPSCPLAFLFSAVRSHPSIVTEVFRHHLLCVETRRALGKGPEVAGTVRDD
jgi:hypothetical protein